MLCFLEGIWINARRGCQQVGTGIDNGDSPPCVCSYLSGKEAKRLIAEGGAKINDAAVTDPGLVLDATDLACPVKLSAGRKRHALIRMTD